jgi:hypothetical protein
LTPEQVVDLIIQTTEKIFELPNEKRKKFALDNHKKIMENLKDEEFEKEVNIILLKKMKDEDLNPHVKHLIFNMIIFALKKFTNERGIS